MANLLWKTKNSTKKLLSTPFLSEEEFEKFVYDTKEILDDIFLIKRQIRGGSKPGIPDIVGIDGDGNVCIVEMKNKKVDYSIIPQVLAYAIWADNNPDSIKALWLEAKDKPEDIELSDSLQVRIIIIAPEILPSTFQYVEKIGYEADLIEVNRWVEKDNHLVLVKKLETEESKKIKTVRGLADYDLDFYNKMHNKESVKWFYKYIDEVDTVIKSKKWALEKKFTKHYCAYKAGFFVAFRVGWVSTKTFAFIINIDKVGLSKFPIKFYKYSDKRKRAYYYITPGKTKTKDFIPLFEKAFKKLSG